MRTLTAQETAILLGGGRWHFRVRVKRPQDAAWINLSDTLGGDWVTNVRVDQETVDQPVPRFTFSLVKTADGTSSAPGIALSVLNRDDADEYAPIIYPGNAVEVYAALTLPDESPADDDFRPWLVGEIEEGEWAAEVMATCVSLDAIIENAWIEEEEERGEADPGTPLAEEIQGLLDRWLGSGVVTLLTIGEPDIGVGRYTPAKGSLGAQIRTLAQRIGWDVRYRWDDDSGAFRYTLYLPPRDKTTADLSIAGEDVRAVTTLRVSREHIRNAFTGKAIDSEGEQFTRTRDNAASIAQFRRRWAEIIEGEDSPIRTTGQLDLLLEYADNDLSQPPTEKRITIPFLPWLSLHDVIDIEADGINFDFTQKYAVVGISHAADASAGTYTEVDLRAGSPVGMYYSWYKFAGRTSQGIAPEILGIEIVARTDTYTDIRPVLSATVSEVWVADRIFDLPLVGEEAPADSDYSSTPLARGDTYRIMVPPQGQYRIVWLAPYTTGLLRGRVRKFELGPAQVSVPTIEYVDVRPGSASNKGDVYTRVRDPQGLGGTLKVWTAKASDADPDPDDAPDATLAVGSTPATIGPTDLSALDEVTIHPGRGKTIFVEFVNEDGVSSEVRSHYVHGFSTLTTLADELRVASVARANILDGAVNDLKLADLAVTNAKLALAAVNTANIVDGALTEVKIATSAITSTKISDGAVETPKLAALAVTAEKIAAGAIIAGKLSAGAIDATSIIANGVITNDLIATGTIQGAKIAAGTITGGNIAGLTITGDKISGNTITADKISVSSLAALTTYTGTLTVESGAGKIQFKQGGDLWAELEPYANILGWGMSWLAYDQSSPSSHKQMSWAVVSGTGVLGVQGEVSCESLSLNGSTVQIGAAGTGPGGSGRALYIA